MERDARLSPSGYLGSRRDVEPRMTAVALSPAAPGAARRTHVPYGRHAARAAAMLLALWILLSAAASGGELATFWLFGLAFGVILQRSRLCFASAFRDLFLLRDGGSLRALLAG